jgi:hypothetical protein
MASERPYIEFRHERTVTDVLNATFVFLRDEFRSLALSLLYIVGPVVIVSAFLTAGTQQGMWGALFDPEAWATGDDPFEDFTALYLIGVLLASIASFLALAVCYSYAMLYEESGPGPFEPREVWRRLVSDFRLYLSTSLWIVLVFVGLMLLNVIPCLGTLAFLFLLAYLLPAMMLAYPARLDRREGFWPALRRCRMLLKGEWWPAFGLVLVTFIVVMIVGTAVAVVVASGFGLVTQLIGSGVIAQLVSVVLSLLSIVSYVAYVLPAVAFVIHYFNLVEQREGIALEARIEQMAREESARSTPGADWGPGDVGTPY